ncbi:MAG: ABC transporter substrate-binding protein [Vulcanimicrobiaceae bacterium]
MTDRSVSREQFLKSAAVGAAGVAFAAPAFIPQLGEAADEIRIGSVEPTTNIYSTYGVYERAGIQLAQEHWNARGGVIGRKVTVLNEDDANDPGIGVQKARKLVQQEKCVALLGTISSALSLSVSSAANALGVIFIDTGGHTDDVTGKDCHWSTFRVCHSTWMETHATGFDLAKRFGKKWYFITPDYAFGHSLEIGYKDVAKKIGVEIVGDDLVPLTATDFSPYLTKVLGTKPDLLLVLVQGDQFVNCLKQANAFGLIKKVPLGGPQVELEAVLSLPKEARVGYWGVEWYYDSPLCIGKPGSLGHKFVDEYVKKFKVKPSARSAFGYIAMDRLCWAMNEAKSTDPVKTARALEGAKFETIFEGSTYFRKEDHQLMWPMWIGSIRPNGTPGQPDNVFDILGRQEADKIEQTVQQKATVCNLGYPT